MLDKNDEKTIRSIVVEGIIHVLENQVLPKFDEIDKRFDDLGENVSELTTAIEVLDRDITGVKMRLGEVEKKVETLIDSSIEVKLHDRRISKLEAAI